MGGRITAALAGTLMEEEDVEVRPERLPAMVTDVSVDICRIKKYFTGEAWLLVEQVLTLKSADPQWMCPICDRDADNSFDDGDTSLACDACLRWYHLTCLGKKSRPKARTWICASCYTDAHT